MSKKSNFHPCLLTGYCFSYIPDFRNAIKKCFSYVPDFRNAIKNIVSYTVNFCNATNTKFVGCKRCGGFCFAFFYALRLNNSCYAEVIFHAKSAMVAKKQAR